MAEQLSQDEIDVIRAYLEANHGDIAKAARATGISPRKLRDMVAQWDLDAIAEAQADDNPSAEEDAEDAAGDARPDGAPAHWPPHRPRVPERPRRVVDN